MEAWSLFFLGGFSAFYSRGKVSYVILCPRCANMATASSNKYNQLMEREKKKPMLWLSSVELRVASFSLLVVHNSSPKLVKMERDFPFHQKFLMALWLWAVLFFDSA